MRLTYRSVIAAVAVVVVASCSNRTVERKLVAPGAIATTDSKIPFLKAHLKDGAVIVFSRWSVDTAAAQISGTGERLDFNRRASGTGDQRVLLDSVALFETNVLRPHSSVAALAVMTGITSAVTVACLTNPKACFGSCPTFYVDGDSTHLLHAEGFSASIAPALEARDIDALHRARPATRDFTLLMTNEALETHVIRHVRLLAAPRAEGERVFATQSGALWRVRNSVAPRVCRSAEGDCTSLISNADGRERLSLTDSTDLAARETVDLVFPKPGTGQFGIVIAARQSLVSTYVLYQALAYLGTSAPYWLAQLNRGDVNSRRQASSVGAVLGGIDVQLRDDSGVWHTVGSTNETGPLATDVKVVPLNNNVAMTADSLVVRLSMSRGMWRVDQVALVSLVEPVTPLVLLPVTVRRDGKVDRTALAALVDSARTLTTFPGDTYAIDFQLPPEYKRLELFLDTRGYYLEWMRSEWLQETNLLRAAQLLSDPAGALRQMAPEFKKRESTMEQAFWSSKYVRQ